MIKIDRKEKPVFTKFNDKIVKESLKKDFYKKCYLCEEVTRHFEVDHFYPQKPYSHLINDYTNLFYCCQKCNKIKPKKIDISSNNEILNCCEIDPEEYIKLSLDIVKCKIEISKIKDDQFSSQIDNTIKILNRIYNGENSNSNSCNDLRDEIIKEIEEFRKIIDKYYKTKLKQSAVKKIQEKVGLKSSYSTFKRWIIRDNNKYMEDLSKKINIREIKT